MPAAAPHLPLQVESLGFFILRGRPHHMPAPHAHADIECNLVLKGKLSYLHGGRYYHLHPGDLAVFWAGIPHRLVKASACEMAWVVIPLAWYMQWQLPGRLTPAMLRGDMVITPREPADDLVMPRWAADFSRTDLDMHRILMLEVEARFRRLARTIRRDDPQHPSLDDATSSHAQQLAAFMASHYRESLTVARIAAAADLHPNYAMTFFKQRCGLSIWEYLTRLRISHAQRLLLTTDWKVHRIALESGFTTLSRFYEAFTRLTRKTPRAYRATTAAKA